MNSNDMGFLAMRKVRCTMMRSCQNARAWGKNALNPIKSQLEQAKKEEAREETVPPMPLPTVEEVELFARKLDLENAAVGVDFSRCGGAQPQYLMSFPDSVAFLEPISPYVAWQVHGGAHMIGGTYYIDWIQNVVGDEILASTLRPVVDESEAMGKQLAAIRPIIRVRLKQYKQVHPELFNTVKTAGERSFSRESV